MRRSCRSSISASLSPSSATQERLISYRIRPIVIRGDGGDVHWIYRPEFVDPAGEGRAILDRVWQAQDRLPAR